MTKLLSALSVGVLFSLAAFGQDARAASQSCESLARLSVAKAKILSATVVAAGAFQPPSGEEEGGQGLSSYKKLPAFCRVTIQSAPSTDSDIKIEVWMPVNGWNGRLQAEGNGGFAGYIDYLGMGVALSEGYATASTDTGHSGTPTDAAWALGHPEKVTDFGYRAIHEMTLAAKAAIKSFYGDSPKRSYFGSCSNGGRQALMEVQRFPNDYDGVLAGAPANFWTHLLAGALWDAQALTATLDSYIPSSKLPAIAAAVNASCDVRDGVRDGILSDPRKCHFDPASMLCGGADSDSCLTAAQAATLKKLYEGAHDSHGRAIFPGFLPGAETGKGGWTPWITGTAPGKSLLFVFGTGFFADFVYGDPGWNYRKASLDDAVRAADAKGAHALNATDPDLARFNARAGKLILYHGWDDPAISALNTINYYDSTVRAMGEKRVNSFVRLYMVPGMQHCGGGPGPDSFGAEGAPRRGDPQHDVRAALEQWVERGIAPGAIVTTKFADNDPSKAVRMTRPLCPYPQSAKYKGSGDTNDAGNFTCGEGN
jgi:Tannase and feruloyl esterase